MKMKRPMITIDLKRKVLEGNHLTPLWGPVGGEEWGSLIEESLGGLLGGGGGGGGGGNGGEDIIDRDDANAKAVRAKLGYEEVEKLVDELVAWLDEGSL